MDVLFLKLCGALITIFFGVLLPFGINYIKEKIGEVKFNQILEYVKKAVEAAQQVIGKDECDKKKQEVVQYITNISSNKFNINLTEEDIDKLIEAAVFEMKNEIN